MTEEYIELPSMGQILKEELLEPLNLSQNALAKAIGVPSNRIHGIINGTRRITVDTDLRLCKFFDKSDGFFLRIQDNLETRRAKVELEATLDKIIPYNQGNKQEAKHHV